MLLDSTLKALKKLFTGLAHRAGYELLAHGNLVDAARCLDGLGPRGEV